MDDVTLTPERTAQLRKLVRRFYREPERFFVWWRERNEEGGTLFDAGAVTAATQVGLEALFVVDEVLAHMLATGPGRRTRRDFAASIRLLAESRNRLAELLELGEMSAQLARRIEKATGVRHG